MSENYQDDIAAFLNAYYHQRLEELRTAFDITLTNAPSTGLLSCPLAETLSLVAQAASNELDPTTDGSTERAVTAALNDLQHRLFFVPTSTTPCHVPRDWWTTTIGTMMIRALIWSRINNLITLAEAAQIRGVTIQAIHNAIKDGRLRGYINPDAPARQGRTLVSRPDVDALGND